MRRVAQVALRTLLALALSVVLLELTLRFLLFSDVELVARLGAPLRRESLYAPADSVDVWKLKALFSGDRARKEHPFFDAQLGYIKQEIDPHTYRHSAEASIRSRRPVLLYGDSFADGVTRTRTPWDELLDASHLAEEFALLNYGIGGYGVDQIALMLDRTIDLYADRNPVVVFAILVDDDLDRCYLPVRDFPKPHFKLNDGALELQRPEARSAREFVDKYPPEFRSYFGRFLLFSTDLFPVQTRSNWIGERASRPIKEQINARLIARVQQDLERRGLTYFFLLFHGKGSVKSVGPFSWQEPFLYSLFKQRGIPFVSSKRALLEEAYRSRRALDSYFNRSNHYMPRAYEVVFETMLSGLEECFEPYEYLPGAPALDREASSDG